MCQQLEDAASALALSARLRVEAPEERRTRGVSPRRAACADAGVEGRESTEQQVDARREEGLLLASGLRATCERAEREEAVGGALGLGELAIGEQRASQLREVGRVRRGLLEEQLQWAEARQRATDLLARLEGAHRRDCRLRGPAEAVCGCSGRRGGLGWSQGRRRGEVSAHRRERPRLVAGARARAGPCLARAAHDGE